MTTDNLASTSENIMYNTMVKTYRDGSKQILCATKRVFREPGWESNLVYPLNLRRMGTDRERREAAEAEIRRAMWEYKMMREGKLGEGPDLPEDWDADAPWWDIDPAWWTEAEAMRKEIKDRERSWESLQRSMRRARVKVRDYCLSTDMKYFCTFTLDQEKIDRYDIKVITKKLSKWLNNQVERKGIAYVMVPELHQDGAIHFHGMLTEGLEVVDSGTIIPRGEDRPRRPHSEKQAEAWLRDGGRKVYNLPGWPYGFTTALELEGNYEAAVNYVSKYISKGLGESPDYLPCKVGGRWYYSGGALGRPDVEFFNSNMEDLQDAFGGSAHAIDLSRSLSEVEMIVVWITAAGVPR